MVEANRVSQWFVSPTMHPSPSNRRGRDAFQIWNGHRGWCLVSIGCPITQRPVITLHVQHKPSFQGFPCCRNYHTQRNSFRGKQWLGGLGLGLPPPPPWMWHPHAKRHSDETEFRWMALQLCKEGQTSAVKKQRGACLFSQCMSRRQLLQLMLTFSLFLLLH